MAVPSRALQDAGATFFPPALPNQIQALETRLGFALPDELRALYLDHNGEEESLEPVLMARQQNLDELGGALDELNEFLFEEAPALQGQFLPIWSDDNGNFFVYFLHGLERGMIGWMNHENPWYIEPHYRNVAGLYAALSDAYQRNDFDLSRDYDGDSGIGDRELHIFGAHLTAYDLTLDAPLRDYHGAFLLMLCPSGRERELLPLLHDSGLGVLAGNLLARRGCQWALDDLIDAVREHAPSLTLAYNLLEAIMTLKAPGTTDALLGLARIYPATLSVNYLADALERCGLTQERPINAQGERDHSRIKVDTEPGGWLVLPWG